MRRHVAAALLLAITAAVGRAQVLPGQVTVSGLVQQFATYSVAGLATMPALEVQGAREGGATSAFVGTPLWPIIEAAWPVDGPERGSRLQHVLFARGADGYTVALATGEIDPRFEGKPVIIAYKQDGAPLPSPRLVVPGDRAAGRNVRDLVAVEVR